MTLLAIGLNHKTAPVELREQVAFTADSLVEALISLKGSGVVDEAVIVSTCNRTEIYTFLADADADADADTDQSVLLRKWLTDFHGLQNTDLLNHIYTYQDLDAVQHIMRVASGLDSLVLGEPQILGQVKQAFNDAKHTGVAGANLERLFQHTFAIAKKVRTETDIGSNAVSVAYASVQLAKHIFADLVQQHVLLVGAGETIELVAQHLKEQGVKHLWVANRTLAKAQTLASKLAGQALTLSQLPSHLAEADIVISSTASQLPLIGKGMVEQALKSRKNRPMFMVDLAIPRDIEEEVAHLDNAYLYTVDDLQQIVEQNIASRQVAAQSAEQMIVDQANAYVSWKQSRDHVDLVREYRRKGTEQSDYLLGVAKQQIADGKPVDEALKEFAHKLSNHFMHAPTKVINTAIKTSNGALKMLLEEAFELNKGTSGNSDASRKSQ